LDKIITWDGIYIHLEEGAETGVTYNYNRMLEHLYGPHPKDVSKCQYLVGGEIWTVTGSPLKLLFLIDEVIGSCNSFALVKYRYAYDISGLALEWSDYCYGLVKATFVSPLDGLARQYSMYPGIPYGTLEPFSEEYALAVYNLQAGIKSRLPLASIPPALDGYSFRVLDEATNDVETTYANSQLYYKGKKFKDEYSALRFAERYLFEPYEKEGDIKQIILEKNVMNVRIRLNSSSFVADQIPEYSIYAKNEYGEDIELSDNYINLGAVESLKIYWKAYIENDYQDGYVDTADISYDVIYSYKQGHGLDVNFQDTNTNHRKYSDYVAVYIADNKNSLFSAEPKLVKNYDEFVNLFGSKENCESEIEVAENEVEIEIKSELFKCAYAHFVLYKNKEAVFINAHDDLEKSIESVEKIFPVFSAVPYIVCLCGEYDLSIYEKLSKSLENINGSFSAIGVVDIRSSEKSVYDIVNNVSNNTTTNNNGGTSSYNNSYIHNKLTLRKLVACYPKIKIEGVSYFLSSIFTSIADSNFMPCQNISNVEIKNMISAILADNTSVESIEMKDYEANYLNENGIFTVINYAGKYLTWGNNLACFAETEDIKDTKIVNRFILDYLRNDFTLYFFERIDRPVSKVFLSSLVNSYNVKLNTLIAKGVLLNASIELSSISDDGRKIDFYIKVSPMPSGEYFSISI